MSLPGCRFFPSSAALLLLASCGLTSLGTASADEILIEEEPSGGDEIMIDDGSAGGGPVIEQGAAGSEGVLIDDGAPGQAAPQDTLIIGGDSAVSTAPAMPEATGGPRFAVDDVRLEYGQQIRDASEADREFYGKLAVSLEWQPRPEWEVRLAGRLDGYSQDGRKDWSELRADYGDSYVRYRGDGYRVTAGAQTVIWGRLDEIPLSDRVSTVDLSRFLLDKLEDRRRATPMLRAETNLGQGKLDLVWLYSFRAAELPDQDSIWYPVNRTTGRILGVNRKDIAPAVIQAATIIEDEPNGNGGFGIRYTASPYFGDIGITVAKTRRSVPYFQVVGVGPPQLKTVYPRSWAFGADTAVDAAGITWRAEVVYSSDNPVTRRDGLYTYTTTPGIDWGFGAEMHPGDGDTRVNLQLVGSNLIDAPAVLDRTQAYNLNGEIETPFDHERWRASFDFFVGLDKKDLFLNPEIAFLGWEPHELYLALNYFEGDEQTLGGFHQNHSSLNLGWRAKF